MITFEKEIQVLLLVRSDQSNNGSKNAERLEVQEDVVFSCLLTHLSCSKKLREMTYVVSCKLAQLPNVNGALAETVHS